MVRHGVLQPFRESLLARENYAEDAEGGIGKARMIDRICACSLDWRIPV